MQGVGFRDWTARRAKRLGVSGWVRNRSDGTVEALLSGSPDSVEAVLELCRKGPPLARVDDVTLTPAEAPAETTFRKLPTV